MYLLFVTLQYVSESDILGPNGNLSDIKNLVSLERDMFEDSSYKYRIKNFLLFVSISLLWNTCLKHHIEWCTLNWWKSKSMSIIWPFQFNQ